MNRHSALLLLALVVPAAAQLPTPNATGVSSGHDVLLFHDLPAANQFFAALGGEPTELGPLKMTKIPGKLLLVRKGDPKGGTEGSTIEFLGFKVRNLHDALAQLKAIGITPLAGNTASQAFVLAPDGLKIRLREDSSLASPIASDVVKMVVPDLGAAQAWYEKWFGAKLVKHGDETVGDIPGSNLLFAQATDAVAPTRGRVLDRIGLEVKDVQDLCHRMEDSGIKLDSPYRKAPNPILKLAVCVLTDPWGTTIEVSEGLAAAK